MSKGESDEQKLEALIGGFEEDANRRRVLSKLASSWEDKEKNQLLSEIAEKCGQIAKEMKMEKDKLKKLCEIEGFDDEMSLFDAFIIDSVCPGICVNPDCDFTINVEPDQDQGWCDECQTNTVKSVLILGGII